VSIMDINIYNWNELTEDQKTKIFKRSEIDITNVSKNVSAIINKVKNEGDAALYELAAKYEKAELTSLKVSAEEFDEAYKIVPEDIKDAIDFSIKNVRTFHKNQVNKETEIKEIIPGVFAGEKVTPIDSAGLYVPQGRGKFPSMLYMLAVPAVEAGVKRICVVSPPDSNGKIDPACLYAAKECGVTEIYKVGGAQAIAALTFGTETIEPVAKISGPGSMFVTAAKRLLYGTVDVGLPAGPSESVVIADSTADPHTTALDLITEAEHGADSAAILLTDSSQLAKQTAEEITKLTEALSPMRREFVENVMKSYGGIIITENEEQSIEIANLIATEHLQIVTEDPHKTAERITNAGEIIIGPTPFSAANYSIGANAVLPTGANARTFSAVSVRDFVKYSSVIYTTEEGLKETAKHAKILAEYEGFDSHAKALNLNERK
jgi:histidinol dehydrogenase